MPQNYTSPVFIYDDTPTSRHSAAREHSDRRAQNLKNVAICDELELTGSRGKHALVQRLNAGERVDLIDGNGLRAGCQVIGQIAGGLALEVAGTMMEPLPAVNITLVQALAKSDRDELAIETAVEVGVDAVIPWQADRSIVQWRPDKADKAKSRWVEAVKTATKQARRAYLPPVYDVVNSKRLANLIGKTILDDGAVWVLDAAATATAATASIPSRGELLIIVGPEAWH